VPNEGGTLLRLRHSGLPKRRRRHSRQRTTGGDGRTT
jgi:hypothetical protein